MTTRDAHRRPFVEPRSDRVTHRTGPVAARGPGKAGSDGVVDPPSRARLKLDGTGPVAAGDRCPKCDSVQWSAAASCHSCGIVFEKWAENEARKAAELHQAAARKGARPLRIAIHRSGFGFSATRSGLLLASFGAGVLAMVLTANLLLDTGSWFSLGFALPAQSVPVIGAVDEVAPVVPATAPSSTAAAQPGDVSFRIIESEWLPGDDGGHRLRLVFENASETTVRELKVQGVGVDRRGHVAHTKSFASKQILGPKKSLEATLNVSRGIEIAAVRIGHWRQALDRVPVLSPTTP